MALDDLDVTTVERLLANGLGASRAGDHAAAVAHLVDALARSAHAPVPELADREGAGRARTKGSCARADPRRWSRATRSSVTEAETKAQRAKALREAAGRRSSPFALGHARLLEQEAAALSDVSARLATDGPLALPPALLRYVVE